MSKRDILEVCASIDVISDDKRLCRDPVLTLINDCDLKDYSFNCKTVCWHPISMMKIVIFSGRKLTSLS